MIYYNTVYMKSINKNNNISIISTGEQSSYAQILRLARFTRTNFGIDLVCHELYNEITDFGILEFIKTENIL